jgi:hypothetical protein
MTVINPNNKYCPDEGLNIDETERTEGVEAWHVYTGGNVSPKEAIEPHLKQGCSTEEAIDKFLDEFIDGDGWCHDEPPPDWLKDELWDFLHKELIPDPNS